MVSAILSILISITSGEVRAGQCLDDFQSKLAFLSTHPHQNSMIEFTQQRLSLIYPRLYSLKVDAAEKLELTQTLQALELINNKKNLFSEYEEKFALAYQAFVSKERDPILLHDYFRALARGDSDAAAQSGDLILASIIEEKRALYSEMAGIYGSKAPYWNTKYRKLTEVETDLIQYADQRNSGVMGVKASLLPDQKSKIADLSKAMKDVHGVYVASVPEALEKLSSSGFSTRSAAFKPFRAPDTDAIQAPMIIIPEKDLLYDRVSSVTRHEVRHAHYATLRQQYTTSPFDVVVEAIGDKPMGEALGYHLFQSYEEVSTHAKDLLYSVRTGNREVLNLYKKHPILHANEVFDLGFMETKANTLQKISDQTVKTATRALNEIKNQKDMNFEKIADIHVNPSKEGYIFGFPVEGSFFTKITFSSKKEKEVIKKFVDDYRNFQLENQAAIDAGVPVSAEVSQKGVDALKSAFDLAEEKLNRSLLVATRVKSEVDAVYRMIHDLAGSDMKMSQSKYLEIRNVISKPARQVSGLAIRDPEEYMKAIREIKAQRAGEK